MVAYHRAVTALLVALSGGPALAQEAPAVPTNDVTLQRLWRLGIDSSHVQSLAQTLFDSIGPRLTGSPGLLSASNWVIATYHSWGIDARRETYGVWRGWRRGPSHIDLVSPRARSLEGTMLAWSPGTLGHPIVAPVIVLPKFTDSLEFVKWLPRSRGKIVLLSPEWPTCRPSEDWYRWATPASMARMDTSIARMQHEWSVMTTPDGRADSAKLYRGTGYSLAARGTGTLGVRLDKAGVAAVIISSPRMNGFSAAPGAGGWGTYEVYETYNTAAPAVALSCEDYGLLFRLAAHQQQPVVRLDLDASVLGDQPAFNTIATIKGTTKPDEYVLLSAHLDSWDGGSGATDNGAGTIMVMEAMRLLASAYPHPKRTIIAGHWSGEEEGEVGSAAYSEDHPEVVKGLQAMFNQDNGTGRMQSIWASGLPDMAHHLSAWYSRLPSVYTDSTSPYVFSWTFDDVPPSSNFSTDAGVFACKAAPAFFLRGQQWSYFTYTWHTNRDTYDKLVFDDLASNATLAAMLAYEAAEDPRFVSRGRSPGQWPADCHTAPRKTRPRF
jgi:carboxypeptidase Q